MSTLTPNPNPSDVKFTPYAPAENEEYMSDEQLAHFKAILLDWKHQLIGEADLYQDLYPR